MLDFIRQRAHGWLAWVIVVLIAVPFALWGVNEYFRTGRDTPVAEVNGVPISQQQVQTAYSRQRAQLQELLGENFRPEMFPEERIRQAVLQELIQQELLVQAAARSGLRIADAQLAKTVRDVPAFQRDGRFAADLYEQVISREGMRPGNFEALVRRDLLSQQYYEGLVKSGFATEQEVNDYLRLTNQRRDVGFVKISAATFAADVSVSDEEIAADYESNAARYSVPERVKVDYIELDARAIAETIAVDDETLRTRYEAQQANYREPEQRRARHILVAVPADAAPEADQAARQEAEAVLEKLREGAAFDALAKEHSDDPGSAKEGGDLGFFGRGSMVPPFEQAAFALKPGEVSDLVRSDFGYHVIKLEEVRGGELKPFDQVRDQIKRDVQREQADQIYYDKADQLANLTYEHPDTLQTASEQLGLPVKETEPFPRSGGTAGVAANPKFAQAAFSEDVLAKGNNSEAIELAPNRLVVLRVAEHLPESSRPLDEVKGEITAALAQKKAAKLAEEKAAAVETSLASAGDAATVVKEAGLEWQRAEAVARDSTEIDTAIVQAAFRMARPAQGASTVERISLRGGDQAVIVLYGVQAADVGGVDAAEREQARTAVVQAAEEAVASAVIGNLRAAADVKSP